MHDKDMEIPEGKKYMTKTVWAIALLVWCIGGGIGCGIMYLFVNREQERIRMEVYGIQRNMDQIPVAIKV